MSELVTALIPLAGVVVFEIAAAVRSARRDACLYRLTCTSVHVLDAPTTAEIDPAALADLHGASPSEG